MKNKKIYYVISELFYIVGAFFILSNPSYGGKNMKDWTLENTKPRVMEFYKNNKEKVFKRHYKSYGTESNVGLFNGALADEMFNDIKHFRKSLALSNLLSTLDMEKEYEMFKKEYEVFVKNKPSEQQQLLERLNK